MIAPRKTLWSTPDEVVAVAWKKIQENILLAESTEDGVICDIGCGDGRVLLTWAESYSKIFGENISVENKERVALSFLGIDVEESRVEEARRVLHDMRLQGRISECIQVEFRCENALHAMETLSNIRVLFLYLIPRGLRLIQPHLRKIGGDTRPLIVLSYISRLFNERVIPNRELVTVSHQRGSSWPLYTYTISKDD